MAFVIAALLGAGCSHFSYTRGGLDTIAADTDDDTAPHDQPLDFTKTKVTATTHELQFLDATGVVCAGLMTATDQAASAQARAIEAERNHEFGVLSYKWKVFSPSEFGGYPCGMYVRWSDDVKFTGTGLGTPSGNGPSHYGEAGIMLAGWDETPIPSLFFGAQTRPAIGFYSANDGVASEDVYLRLPVTFGGMFAPPWLAGLGLRAYAGFDIISLLLLSRGAVFRDGFWVPFDYGVSASWSLPVLDYGSVTLQAGWMKEVTTVRQQILQQGHLFGEVGLVVNWGRIFGK